jgi:hypothetical protein
VVCLDGFGFWRIWVGIGMIYVKGEWGFLIGAAIDNIAGVAGGLKYKGGECLLGCNFIF